MGDSEDEKTEPSASLCRGAGTTGAMEVGIFDERFMKLAGALDQKKKKNENKLLAYEIKYELVNSGLKMCMTIIK